MRRLLLWAPPILYMALIFHLSSESAPVPELTAHVWDKLLHCAGYGALGAMFYRAFAGEGAGRARAMLLAIVAASLYGVTDEWHQSFVPMRSSDVLDWVADTIGGAIAVVVYAALQYGFTSAASTSTDTA